jgi:hypothetical protein
MDTPTSIKMASVFSRILDQLLVAERQSTEAIIVTIDKERCRR